jgi:hypothetical protein
MNWKLCERKRSWPNLWYDRGICLAELRKTTKNLRQDCQSSGLNPGLPEYKAGVLTTQLRHSVTHSISICRHIKLTTTPQQLQQIYPLTYMCTSTLTSKQGLNPFRRLNQNPKLDLITHKQHYSPTHTET